MAPATCHTVPGLAGNSPHNPAPAAPDAALQPVFFETLRGPVRFAVEVAQTPEAQARGLMFRRSLPRGRGMLFVFGSSRPRRFWMKHTYIPLDMIFIDAESVIVGIVASAEPESLQERGPSAACRYVIEVAGGTAQSLQLRPGQRVRLPKALVGAS